MRTKVVLKYSHEGCDEMGLHEMQAKMIDVQLAVGGWLRVIKYVNCPCCKYYFVSSQQE